MQFISVFPFYSSDIAADWALTGEGWLAFVLTAHIMLFFTLFWNETIVKEGKLAQLTQRSNWLACLASDALPSTRSSWIGSDYSSGRPWSWLSIWKVHKGWWALWKSRSRSVRDSNTQGMWFHLGLKWQGEKPNEINYSKSKGEHHNRKCTRKDGGSTPLALGIWLAQQQLKDLGSRQSNYSVF